MRVLLVDDDDTFRARLARTLRQREVEVDEARCVSSAIECLSSKFYDCGIVDLKMDGPNGLTLIPIAKEKNKEMRLVVLTGYGSVATTTQAFKSGAADYLTKPASIEDILSAIGLGDQRSLHSNRKLPTLEELQEDYLNRVLIDCNGNVSQAAKLLGIHRRSLQRKLSRRS